MLQNRDQLARTHSALQRSPPPSHPRIHQGGGQSPAQRRKAATPPLRSLQSLRAAATLRSAGAVSLRCARLAVPATFKSTNAHGASVRDMGGLRPPRVGAGTAAATYATRGLTVPKAAPPLCRPAYRRSPLAPRSGACLRGSPCAGAALARATHSLASGHRPFPTRRAFGINLSRAPTTAPSLSSFRVAALRRCAEKARASCGCQPSDASRGAPRHKPKQKIPHPAPAYFPLGT